MSVFKQENLSFIGVVGPTASGKSSLISEFTKRGYVGLRELSPKNNPYLFFAYSDIQNKIKPSKNVFYSQRHFIDIIPDQISQISDLLQLRQEVIFEMPNMMYAHILHQNGFLTKKMFTDCINRLTHCLDMMDNPDLVLVPTVPSAIILQQRILERAHQESDREGETSTSLDYWEQQLLYWKTESELRKLRKVLLNTDERECIDWRNEAGFNQLIQYILTQIVLK